MTRRAKTLGLAVLVGIAAIAGLAAFLLRGDPAPPRDWSVAEAAWKEYARGLFDHYKQTGYAIPRGGYYWARFTSQELERFFPDARFYVVHCPRPVGITRLGTHFAVSLCGKVEDLGDVGGNSNADSPELAHFIDSAGIVIQRAEDAADVARCIEQIRYDYGDALDHPIGETVISRIPGEGWSFMAGREGAEWVVSRVGLYATPGSIEFRFAVDDKGVVRRVKYDTISEPRQAQPTDMPRPVS